MATANEIITDAALISGWLGDSNALDANTAQLGLRLLNDMLDSWSIDRLKIHQIQQRSFALTIGDGTYTIGPSGDYNTTRPTKILTAFIRDSSNVDYPVTMIPSDEWARIANKTVRGRPYLAYSDGSMATTTLNLYYVPDQAYTFYFDSMYPLQSFSGLTTAVSAPPGYLRAFKYNLAVEIAGANGMEATATVMSIARESREAIERINAPEVIAGTDVPARNRGTWDWRAGE